MDTLSGPLGHFFRDRLQKSGRPLHGIVTRQIG
jgi:hypothetical protein